VACLEHGLRVAGDGCASSGEGVNTNRTRVTVTPISRIIATLMQSSARAKSR
jgi:hypothetical protein